MTRHDEPMTFDEAVRQEMEANPKLDRVAASARAARKYPDLHREFLRETNPGREHLV